MCAQGQCVTGQGTCATGADGCNGSPAPCDGPACYCFTTRENQTRCGAGGGLTGCDTCASDADCATLLPDTPGAFCVRDTGPSCTCGGYCVAPCPIEMHG